MNTEKQCDMVMIEDGDLQISWECSACGAVHKGTTEFEKAKACPQCGSPIGAWVGIDDDCDS